MNLIFPWHDTVSRFEDFRLDQRDGLARRHGKESWVPIPLGSRALDVLRALVERSGELVTKQALMDAAWPGMTVEDANLTVQISTLRRVLDEGRAGGSCIRTVIGRGYRFLPAVTSHAADAPSAGQAAALPAGAAESRPRLSLVVLPFRNIGGDPGADHLAELITDDLVTDLSRWPRAFVMARASVAPCDGEPPDACRVGAELGVNYVIQGSVRGSAKSPGVSVRLIDAETGEHLWAERFDIEGDIDAEISGRLSHGLAGKLVEAVGRRIEALPPEDRTSDDLVMLGLAIESRPPSAAREEAALRWFEQALDRDPESLDARVRIAGALLNGLLNGWSRSVERDRARAEQLLLEVLHGDAGISRAHAHMGMLRRVQGRLGDSAAELEIAVGLSPNHALASGQLGLTLAYLGRPEAAMAWIGKSLRLAPRDPGTPARHWAFGLCHLLLGHGDEAVVWLRKARAGHPRSHDVFLWLAAGLGLRGETDEARACLRRALEIKPEINSLPALRARWRTMASAEFIALCEGTACIGLRRAGLPDEQ